MINDFNFNMELNIQENEKEIPEKIKDFMQILSEFIFFDNINKAYSLYIVMSELMHNAIKYSVIKNSLKRIKFKLDKNKNSPIKIEIENSIDRGGGKFKKFTQIFNSIISGLDASELYLKRIRDIINSKSKEKGNLGLILIAQETKKRMNYNIRGDNLIITVELD